MQQRARDLLRRLHVQQQRHEVALRFFRVDDEARVCRGEAGRGVFRVRAFVVLQFCHRLLDAHVAAELRAHDVRRAEARVEEVAQARVELGYCHAVVLRHGQSALRGDAYAEGLCSGVSILHCLQEDTVGLLLQHDLLGGGDAAGARKAVAERDADFRELGVLRAVIDAHFVFAVGVDVRGEFGALDFGGFGAGQGRADEVVQVAFGEKGHCSERSERLMQRAKRAVCECECSCVSVNVLVSD